MDMSLCYNCFKEFDGGGVCPHCGYDAAAEDGKHSLALRPGTILDGRYIVGRVLGQGGFGISYLALEYDSKRILAIKEFFPVSMVTRLDDGSVRLISESMAQAFRDGRQSFLEEARALSRFMGMDNICQIYSYFEEKGTAYFTMDYVPGCMLGQWLKEQGGTLSFEKAAELLLPVMHALCHVHEKGIIHRDISPDNIMVSPEGKATLIDFGAARYSMGEKSQSLDVILRHGFAPKEQYAKHGRQGPYTDVYAMAATLYYAISGRKPPDAIERAYKDELLMPSKLGIKLPAGAEKLLLTALAVEKEQRYQRMEDFVQALEAVLAGKTKKSGGAKLLLPVLAAAIVLALALFMIPKKENPPAPAETVVPAVQTYTPAAETPAPEQMPEEPESTAPPIDWELSADGRLSVCCDGAMADFAADEAPWLADGGARKITSVEIQEGCTYIGANAFSGCGRLEKISMPESLKEIGEEAFSNCWELRALELPPALEQIGAGAFADCRALSEIIIPGSVQRIGEGAFENCNMATELEIKEGVKQIGREAFSNCRRISRVQLPKSLESIEAEAFNRCSDIQWLGYGGDEENWESIELDSNGNSTLLDAARSYNS